MGDYSELTGQAPIQRQGPYKSKKGEIDKKRKRQ